MRVRPPRKASLEGARPAQERGARPWAAPSDGRGTFSTAGCRFADGHVHVVKGVHLLTARRRKARDAAVPWARAVAQEGVSAELMAARLTSSLCSRTFHSPSLSTSSLLFSLGLGLGRAMVACRPFLFSRSRAPSCCMLSGANRATIGATGADLREGATSCSDSAPCTSRSATASTRRVIAISSRWQIALFQGDL